MELSKKQADPSTTDDELELGLVAGRVRAALDEARLVDARGLQVVVRGGELVICGVVGDDHQGRTAQGIAEQAAGLPVSLEVSFAGGPVSPPPADAVMVLPSADAAGAKLDG